MYIPAHRNCCNMEALTCLRQRSDQVRCLSPRGFESRIGLRDTLVHSYSRDGTYDAHTKATVPHCSSVRVATLKKQMRAQTTMMLPVAPYANTVTLMPSSSSAMCGLAVPSYTLACPASGGNTASNEYSFADPCQNVAPAHTRHPNSIGAQKQPGSQTRTQTSRGIYSIGKQ